MMDDQHIDRNLKQIIRQAGLMNPSPGFTQRVMEKIHQIPVEITQIIDKKERVTDRILFAGLAGAGVLATAWYFISYHKDILFRRPEPLYWSLLEKITESLGSVFLSFRISSITLAVIGAILLVIATDLIIKKIQSARKHFLLL
jgi:hypothetical protein